MGAAHCATCEAYERTVMGRRAGEPMPAEVSPCPSYVMSDAMRDWAVAQMQGEVRRQVSGAGLDRMAMLKRPASAPPRGLREGADEQEQG